MTMPSSPSTPPRRGTPFLYLTVTLSGAAVMILELLGTRIIGPFYGVSLYVWSSLIAVTLVALALGYYLGGYIADRYPGCRLEHLILGGALATAAIPFADGPILTLTDPLGIRTGAFVSALLLFTLPLTGLAMVGPYAIKRAAHELEGVGQAVGSIYAVSTLGSVAGTLLLGFYLLPQFGTRAILFSLSLVLVALAAVLALFDRYDRPQASWAVWGIGILAGLLSFSGFAQPARQAAGFQVLHEAESIYGWVRVVEDQRNGYRLLLSDASVLSAVEHASGRSLLNYQWFFRWIPLFRPAARDALLIGLGGGHVARDLKTAGIATDTIEIDPEVAYAAQKYFDFKPTGAFIVGDARYEIKRLHSLRKRYDFIMHDCFTGGSEPTHLLSREMLAELRGLLNSGGILALNYVGFRKGEGAEAVASVHKTLHSLFPRIRTFTTEKDDFTDFVFLASAEPLELDANSPDRRVRVLLENEFTADEAGGILITDDYNPMESLQVRKAETYRKLFMERVAFDLLLR